MLSREDSRRLAELERHLLRDDPEFCARMSGGQPAPGHRRRVRWSLIIVTTLLWLTAVAFGVLTWWIPAVIAAVLATAATATVTYLLIRRARRN